MSGLNFHILEALNKLQDTSKDFEITISESKKDEENFLQWAKKTLDDSKAKMVVDLFKERKLRLDPKERDLYYWIKNKDGLDLLIALTGLGKSNHEKEEEAKNGAKIVVENDHWRVYDVTTYPAATFYGRGTKWCISGNYPGYIGRGQSFFNDYLENDFDMYLFCISKDEKGKKFCICPLKVSEDDTDDNGNSSYCNIYDAQDGEIFSREDRNIDEITTELRDLPIINYKGFYFNIKDFKDF